MLNCAIYPRKSKVVDNSDSMQVQVDMCIKYLDGKYGEGNYTYTIYDGDYGITGHSIKARKDFQRMMADVSAKKIQLVLVQRYDRLARNTRDFCNVYHDMERAGCELVSVSQQIDTTTPYGKNFMYMQASMAELEWALCSERRKDANRYAVAQGKAVVPDSSTPLGYKTAYIDGIRRIVIDSDTEHIVRDLFAYYRQFRNYTATARYINNKYGLKMTNNSVKKLIRNTLFKGQYKSNVHFCKPYLTENEWDDLQKDMTLIRFDTTKKSEPLFSGLCMCPCCGRRMKSQIKTKKKTGHSFRYYLCEYHYQGMCDNQKSKSELLLEKMVIDYIEQYLSGNSIDIQAKEKKKISTKKRDIDAEIDRLNTMFLKGRISEEKYDAEYLRLTQEKSLYEANTQPQAHDIQAHFDGNWKDIYNSLDGLHKKLFWREIIQEIHFTKDMLVDSIIFL